MSSPRQEPWIAVQVKIPAELSRSGREEWKAARIDAPVAPIVAALRRSGMRVTVIDSYTIFMHGRQTHA